jgi:hypothetical protein
MASKPPRRGEALFEALREVMGAMSSPEEFGMQLFAALEGGWKRAPRSVRAALTEIGEGYDERTGR